MYVIFLRFKILLETMKVLQVLIYTTGPYTHLTFWNFFKVAQSKQEKRLIKWPNSSCGIHFCQMLEQLRQQNQMPETTFIRKVDDKVNKVHS